MESPSEVTELESIGHSRVQCRPTVKAFWNTMAGTERRARGVEDCPFRTNLHVFLRLRVHATSDRGVPPNVGGGDGVHGCISRGSIGSTVWSQVPLAWL